MGLYGQDSWRTTSNLTLNYGLRWEFATPWYEQHNEIETIVPGLQSKVFPNSPVGWVFPGDPGIPKTLAPIRYNNFAPRIGLAYSPSGGDGWLGKLTGAGQTSIRAGFGMFYTSFEGATDFNEIGDAPYGDYYSPSTPTFANPFQNRTNGVTSTSPFPIQLPVPQNLDFGAKGFLPIGASPGFKPTNRLPYAEEYELSIQRQFSSSTLLTLSYVERKRTAYFQTRKPIPEVRPSVDINTDIANSGATLAPCGPTGENNTYLLPPGIAAPAAAIAAGIVTLPSPCSLRFRHNANEVGTRSTYPFNKPTGLASEPYRRVDELHQRRLFRHQRRIRLQFAASKSAAHDEVVQLFGGLHVQQVAGRFVRVWRADKSVQHKLSRALSAFDQTHNFVFSYSYNLPFDKLGGPKRLTKGWQLSGITRFATGLPVTLYETDDNSLLGTANSGPLPIGMDTPLFIGTSIHNEKPRKAGSRQRPSLTARSLFRNRLERWEAGGGSFTGRA